MVAPSNWTSLIKDASLNAKELWQEPGISGASVTSYISDGIEQPTKRLAFRKIMLRVMEDALLADRTAPDAHEQFVRMMRGQVSKGGIDARCAGCEHMMIEKTKLAGPQDGIELTGSCALSMRGGYSVTCPDQVSVIQRGNTTVEKIGSSPIRSEFAPISVINTHSFREDLPKIRMNGKTYTVTADDSSPPKLFLTEEGSSVSHELIVDKTEWVKTGHRTFEKKVSPDAPTIDDELAEVVGDVEAW